MPTIILKQLSYVADRQTHEWPYAEIHRCTLRSAYDVREWMGASGGTPHMQESMASQITNLTIVYSTAYIDVDQRKHQSSASLAFVRGIHRWPVNFPHKGQVTRKMFPFDDVIMVTETHNTVAHFINVLSIVIPSRCKMFCCLCPIPPHQSVSTVVYGTPVIQPWYVKYFAVSTLLKFGWIWR